MVHTVVEHFELNDQGDYHDLYLWTNFLALAACMESMRRGWRKNCGLDLLKCITLPSASYQAMLKMTGVRMELICEGAGAGMPLMEALNDNVRGGASCIFQPYAKANNPRVLPKYPEKPIIPQKVHESIRKGHDVEWDKIPDEYIEWCKKEGYNWEEELSWIIYIDANSLYPTTMCMPLPLSDYEAVVDNIAVDDVKKILSDYTDDSKRGYLIEVDFFVPEHLHDTFDYAPVSKRVSDPSELSQHQHGIGELLGCAKPSVKLIPHLSEHTKELYHAGLLKFWVEMGVVITKVHRVWTYRQDTWMAEYILGMACKRAASNDPVEKEVIKKAINSLYGKVLQDKTTQRNMIPYTCARKFVRAVSRANCMNYTIIQMDANGLGFFGLVETSKKGGVLLDMPRAVGFSVLDTSKLLMLR